MLDISLRTQKILVFIPWVNMFILLIFGLRTKIYNLTLKEQLLAGLLILGSFLAMVGLVFLVEALLPESEKIVPIIMRYVWPFMLGWALIWYQKKIGLDF